MKNKKKVCVVGHFGNGKNCLDGQTVKTKTVTKELINQLGSNEILQIDTHSGKYKLIKLFFQIGINMSNCKNIIIMPATNGLRFFAPILTMWRKIYKTKLHYVVIGGWLPKFLKSRKRLVKILKSFDGIYVETKVMKKALDEQGFTNVYVMPNCKDLKILKKSELVYCCSEPYKLCTFSRVMKEKGIEDAVDTVNAVNKRFKRTVYTLDIYGQVDPEQTEWFEQLKSRFQNCVNYCGIVPFDQSVEVLKNYFALLFPTRFFTEGIPGTIIDAYAAGIPVISSEWESFSDVVSNDITGKGYAFNNKDELHEVLENIALNPQIIQDMKTGCIERAKEFTPEVALDVLVRGGYPFDIKKIEQLMLLNANQCGSSGIPRTGILPLCTFSRVMKEKGIEDAFHAVKTINNNYGRIIFTLDIYGQVDSIQTEWFEKLKKQFPPFVKYKGVVSFNKSVEILKNYFALLFTTYYEGEGFAGTLIDALAAGVPVIASDWCYNAEIVVGGVTGKIHKAKSKDSLIEAINWAYQNQVAWNNMKNNCIRLAYQYLPEKAIDILINQL